MDVAQFRAQVIDGINKGLGHWGARMLPAQAIKVIRSFRQLVATDDDIVRKLLAIYNTIK